MSEEELNELFDKYVRGGHTCYERLIALILTKHKLAIGELQAKVNAYEKIIANSNFNVILGDKENENENN